MALANIALTDCEPQQFYEVVTCNQAIRDHPGSSWTGTDRHNNDPDFEQHLAMFPKLHVMWIEKLWEGDIYGATGFEHHGNLVTKKKTGVSFWTGTFFYDNGSGGPEQ